MLNTKLKHFSACNSQGKMTVPNPGALTWGKLGDHPKVHFIVNELGYSRRFHFWCTDSEDAEHTFEGLIRSFEYLGGVTEEVLEHSCRKSLARCG